MDESAGKNMAEAGKNTGEDNQTKFLAKLPSDWETLSAGERKQWTATLAADLLERFLGLRHR